MADRFHEKVDATGPDCHEWTAACFPSGYGAFRVGNDQRRAHVVAWEIASGGPVPEGLFCLHVCDNRRCVRADDVGTYEVNGVLHPRRGHLWLGTAADNHADREAKGRGRRLHGVENPDAVLIEAEVHAIRRAWVAGAATQEEIAARYGVTQTLISGIVRYEKWAHLVTEGAPPLRTRKRLIPEQIDEIRRIGHSKTLRETAALYGIHSSIVSRIVNGQIHRR